MEPLDYQNADDQRRQARSEWRVKLFGFSRKEIWNMLAREIEADYVERRWFASDRVVANVGSWQLTLDAWGGKHPHTRLRAPFINRQGFRFRIYRKSIFTGLGKALGMQDIEIGQQPFDDDFVIQSSIPELVTQLLTAPDVRDLISVQDRFMFDVKDDDGIFGRFPAGVDQLHMLIPGTGHDVDELRSMFDLFAETLHQMVAIGAAEDYPPGVIL